MNDNRFHEVSILRGESTIFNLNVMIDERVKRTSINREGTFYLNEYRCEFYKGHYSPQLGDLVSILEIDVAESFVVKAFELLLGSIKSAIYINRRDFKETAEVLENFIVNTVPRTFEIEIPEGTLTYAVYHAPSMGIPEADFYINYACRFYKPSGEQDFTLNFERRANDGVFVLNPSGQYWIGTITIERR